MRYITSTLMLAVLAAWPLAPSAARADLTPAQQQFKDREDQQAEKLRQEGEELHEKLQAQSQKMKELNAQMEGIEEEKKWAPFVYWFFWGVIALAGAIGGGGAGAAALRKSKKTHVSRLERLELARGGGIWIRQPKAS